MIRKLQTEFVCVLVMIAAALLAGVLGVVVWFSAQNQEIQSVNIMHKIGSDTKRYEEGKTADNEIRLPFFIIEMKKDGEIKIINGGNFDLSEEAYVRHVYEKAMEQKTDSGMLREQHLRYLKVKKNKIVFSDTTMERAGLRNLVRNCLIMYAVAVLVFAVISVMLSRWIVKPVERAWELQRRFVADASHELKTPLSVILADAELLNNGNFDRIRQAAFSENILKMSYQMRDLLEVMLEMARLDSGAVKAPFGLLDFSQLVTDAALALQLFYEEKGLKMERKIQDAVFVMGCERQLYQVLDVLLDNAQKYAAANATVELTLKAQGRNCVLSVSNPGPQLSTEELDRIFLRFYRGDQARSGNGSYGLGLSIAKAIVQEHKGKIWAKSQDGKVIFYVCLPCGFRK